MQNLSIVAVFERQTDLSKSVKNIVLPEIFLWIFLFRYFLLKVAAICKGHDNTHSSLLGNINLLELYNVGVLQVLHYLGFF